MRKALLLGAAGAAAGAAVVSGWEPRLRLHEGDWAPQGEDSARRSFRLTVPSDSSGQPSIPTTTMVVRFDTLVHGSPPASRTTCCASLRVMEASLPVKTTRAPFREAATPSAQDSATAGLDLLQT